MKLKVGDKVRVKTYEELEESAYGGDWDWPYTYSQGVKGIIIKIEKNDNKLYYLKFSSKEMFEINPYIREYDEEDQKEYILEENQRVPFEECELILIKNNIRTIDVE